MPSNKELAEEARALGKELDVTVETRGLGNSALLSLVSELKTEKRNASESNEAAQPEEAKAPAETAPPVESAKPKAQPKHDVPTPVNGAGDDTTGGTPAPKPEPSKRKFEYQIAEGRSISCNAGILGPGREVRGSFFGDRGQDTLRALVAKGCVVHTPELARKK